MRAVECEYEEVFSALRCKAVCAAILKIHFNPVASALRSPKLTIPSVNKVDVCGD